jgi:hypothetical protein
MGDLPTVASDGRGDLAKRHASAPEPGDLLEPRRHRRIDLERFAVSREPVAPLHGAAKKLAARSAVILARLHALADPVALGLGESAGDREKQLRETVADIAAEVEQVNVHAARFEIGNDGQGVEGGAEEPVKLGRDQHVAALQPGEHGAAGRAIGQRDGSGNALLDDGLGNVETVHQAIAFDLPLERLRKRRKKDLEKSKVQTRLGIEIGSP